MANSFFCLVNCTPKNVPMSQMKFHVDAMEHSGIVGIWRDGKLYVPNKEQFRAALSYLWRMAFDRESQRFWYNKNGNESCHIRLSDRRGNYIATIYCTFKESMK